MIVTIHQPQYLPWLPYLQKVAQSEIFIVLDSVDYQKNGLQNRNQLKTSQGACWLTVPVSRCLGQKITEAEINDPQHWRKKHWQTILNNYRKAPAFQFYAEELEAIYQVEWKYLVDLNMALMEALLRWFEIDVQVLRSSQMQSTGVSSMLILNLCREVRATTYLSGVGGKNYLIKKDFESAGIDLVYVPSVMPQPYPQQFLSAGFFGDLSAVDILFNCGPKWRQHISFDRDASII